MVLIWIGGMVFFGLGAVIFGAATAGSVQVTDDERREPKTMRAVLLLGVIVAIGVVVAVYRASFAVM
jgi:hypothetical protein